MVEASAYKAPERKPSEVQILPSRHARKGADLKGFSGLSALAAPSHHGADERQDSPAGGNRKRVRRGSHTFQGLVDKSASVMRLEAEPPPPINLNGAAIAAPFDGWMPPGR